jgi:hypothetical protein
MGKMENSKKISLVNKRAELTKTILAVALLATLATTGASARDLPNCASAASDPDGDGYGWENEQSCLVTMDSQPAPTPSNPTPSNPAPTGYSNDGKPLCTTPDADSDGDGYGWEFNRSCAVPESLAATVPPNDGKPVCTGANADPDGDGWGWENNQSCVVAAADSGGGSSDDNDDRSGSDSDSDSGGSSGNDPDSNDSSDDSNSDTDDNNSNDDNAGGDSDAGGSDDRAYSARDITDLVLIAGQSNTLGSGTSIDLSKDSPHPRVLAYTDEGWRVAALYQSWDQGAHPGNGDPNSNTSQYHNNFALHFGKRLIERSADTVVGIILTSQPGEGIQHWDRGNTGYQLVQQKVLAAINELPHKSSIDGLLWHQGETDWLLNGTSDPDVPQPAPDNYYPSKLRTLIENFRSEPWYGFNKPFICGETIRADGVNTHLRALNNDSDPYTACVAGAGLPSRSPGGAHFNASALRTIGKRYANEYYSLTN